MPWVPTTDFEEEVVNLQPHHDFIYGVLSEPQHSYPRPKSHMEYAANKKIKEKEEQKERRAGKFNEKLRVIQQVQRMACTKPLGEQPSIDDWEDNNMIEQETVGMMRYCGMGVSVEQPLDQKVTIATYPVENTVKLLKNGRRKVALFFNDDVFKLKEKVSDTSSSGFESCSNSEMNKFDNNALDSELESDNSFNTTSSLSLNSFNTAEECNESRSSVASSIKSKLKNSNEQCLPQYEKLLEDISLLSLSSCKSSSCNSSSQKQSSDSFETAEESSIWRPVLEDENVFTKKENWPVLSKKESASDASSIDNSNLYNEKSDSTDVVSSEAIRKRETRVSFLRRFIKSEDVDGINTHAKLAEPEPKTYAAITKAPKQKEKKESDLITDFQPFYTTRRMYALKRNVK